MLYNISSSQTYPLFTFAHFDTPCKNVEKYEFLYDGNKLPFTLERSTSGSLPEEVMFNLYDTPDLNNTNSHDEIHFANIFDKVKETGGIHLVLAMDGRGPLSPHLSNAIQILHDFFPKVTEVMAFVHAEIYYDDPPSDQTNSLLETVKKTKAIHSTIGRTAFPHIWIECGLERSRLSTIQKPRHDPEYSQGRNVESPIFVHHGFDAQYNTQNEGNRRFVDGLVWGHVDGTSNYGPWSGGHTERNPSSEHQYFQHRIQADENSTLYRLS